MKILKIDKKSESFKYFIFITILPIIGIIFMFSYTFFHFQKDVDKISHEINGLKVITNIEEIIFNIQKIRDLTYIKNTNEKPTEILKEKISQNLISLKKNLILMKNDTSLKSDLLSFLDSIENSSLDYSNFQHLSAVIKEFMLFSNRISYSCKLILDSQLNSFIFIDNIVNLLPQLIEYNYQIKSVTINLKDKHIDYNQKENINIQLDKIKEKLDRLEFNLSLIYKTTQNEDIEQLHEKIKQTQTIIIKYMKKNLLKDEKVSLNFEKNFTLLTKNINLIIDLYYKNLNILNENLQNRLENTKLLCIYIILAGLISILFIIYVNRFFYSRNRKFINKIQKLTITDSMTSLYNRRHFDKVFENNLKIQKRTNQTLIFIILDIDFFKQYNDTYGHQAGDFVIKTIAKNLRESLKRAGDMVFRLGGEEFGILSIGMSNSEALSFADSVRKKVQNEKIEHKKSSVSNYITISMGIVVIEPNSTYSTTDIYRYADKALYKAKENGRNQVVVYNKNDFEESKTTPLSLPLLKP